MITYLIHKKRGWVGVADLPDWVNFDEQPPRSFEIRWITGDYNISQMTTNHVVPITEEVADIMRGV